VDIIVTLKQVPDPEAPKESFRIDDTAMKILNPANVDPVINGFDENAIEAALQMREAVGGKVVAISMGEEGATRALKQALAMGVDEGVLLHDAAFANADATSTAYVLAEAIKKIGTYQLILCGRQASDWDQAQVPAGIAEFLGLPSVTAVQKVEPQGDMIRVQRLLEDGYEVLDVRPPCLVTVSNEANKPRYPTLKGIMAAGKRKSQCGIRQNLVSIRRTLAMLVHAPRSPNSTSRASKANVSLLKVRPPRRWGKNWLYVYGN